MGYSRRSVGVLAILVPFAGCSQLTAHKTAGLVEVAVVDDDAEDVGDAPSYEGSPASEVEVVDETVEKAQARYDPDNGQATATTEANERELRRALEAVNDSDPADGEQPGSYFAGDGVYIAITLKKYD